MAAQWPVTRYSRRSLWPRAAVFDCDGLLIDSAACWRRAYAEVATAPVDLDALAGASVASASTFLGVSEAELRAALLSAVAALRPAPLPGARELVAALGEFLPLAVASNAPLDVLASVLSGFEGFEAVVSAEETPAHKPAPDVYLEACRRLEVEPS